MTTFLLTWNPKRWNWGSLHEQVEHFKSGRIVTGRWSTGNTKRVKLGDRLFLLKQGSEPRGIMASAWATSDVVTDGHWDEVRARQGERTNYVDLQYDFLLDPEAEEILLKSALTRGSLVSVHWNTQSSGIEIRGKAALQLEQVWSEHIRQKLVQPEERDGKVHYFEGETRRGFIVHRRRESRLRDAKIRQALRENSNRLPCAVTHCGFDFLERYGEIGRNYAQVHHLKPLGNRERAEETKLEDLAIVCANCHAMIHIGGECRSLVGLIMCWFSVKRTVLG